MLILASNSISYYVGQALYTTPNVYLDALPFGMIVETDEAGNYRYSVNGQVMFSSTSSSSVINNALGNMTSGKVLYISPGTYYVSTILITIKNVTLCGGGLGSILVLSDNVNANMINVTGDYVTIKDLALRGNRAHQTSGDGIYLNNVLFCRLENLDIRNFKGDGLQIVGVKGNHWVTNNKIVDCSGAAIKLTGGTTDNFIQSNDLGGTHESVLILAGSANDVIVGNRIYMGGWDGSAYDASVGGYGIDIYIANRETISSNQICYNSLDGIRLAHAMNNTISDNYIAYNDQWNDNRAGIYLTGNSTWNKISGGLIRYNYYGIRGVANEDYNTIIDVSVINNDVGIIINGVNTQVHLCYNETTWVP